MGSMGGMVSYLIKDISVIRFDCFKFKCAISFLSVTLQASQRSQFLSLPFIVLYCLTGLTNDLDRAIPLFQFYYAVNSSTQSSTVDGNM